MKKIHTFILTMMIFVITGLFPVAAWASPGPSDFQGADRQYNTSAGKGGGSSSDEGSSIYIPSDAHTSTGIITKCMRWTIPGQRRRNIAARRAGIL